MSDKVRIIPSESDSQAAIFKYNKQGTFSGGALTVLSNFCQLYTHRSLNGSGALGAFARQLCSPLTGDKSPENRMGSVCFKTFC